MFFILLLYLHLISRLLYHVTGTPPWFLRPMMASNSSELYPDYFWLPLFFHLPRALRFWVGIFYPQAFFILRFFPTFWHNLLLSRFHWETAVTFLKFVELHTDPPNTEPAHLFVWFTLIHNLPYILNLYLCMSILQKFLLVVKTLIKNIDQQSK